jgi:predicted transcriptional regulator
MEKIEIRDNQNAALKDLYKTLHPGHKCPRFKTLEASTIAIRLALSVTTRIATSHHSLVNNEVKVLADQLDWLQKADDLMIEKNFMK